MQADKPINCSKTKLYNPNPMKRLMKVFAGCFLLLAVLSLSVAQAQDMTELKVVNGTEEASEIKVAIAVKMSEGEPPMVAKVITLKEFGDYNIFSIPSANEIMIGALPSDASIEGSGEIPSEYAPSFIPISIEMAKSCDVTVKGNLVEANFILSNIKW